MIKKFYAGLVMVCACLSSICGFATPSGENSTVVISQVDAVDYVIIIGGVIFLIGILFILLSMYARVKNKEADGLYDDAEGYDTDEDYYEEDAAAVEDETQEAEETEADVPEAEVADSEEIAETEEAEEPDEPMETEEDTPEEAAEVVEEEKEVQKESVVRVTLTGTNNADLKIAEFSHTAKVGRRGTNDIMISDNAVSGEHCEFVYEDGIVYIQDLNSTNGTLLNGEVIEKEEVKTGDLIIVGKHQYKVNISL